MRWLIMVLASVLSVSGPMVATAQTPAFDPRTWQGTQAGQATQILTIGSTHLAQMAQQPEQATMEDVLAKLAAFKPQIITHEGISGEQCTLFQQFPARYPDMFDTYCYDPKDILAATGMTVPIAMEDVEKTLAAWPAKPTAAQRRRLISLFLSANDRASALVQWLQLAPADRVMGDGIDALLLKTMQTVASKKNETYMIACVLAARMGLQRVYAVDDHTADSIDGLAGENYMPAIRAIWKSESSPEIAAIFKQYETLEKDATTAAKMLVYYRFLNAPATQIASVEGDFAKAMRTPSTELYGRQYLGWNETRNLRMVANIRAAFANQPGGRVLNIVGASHKAYYDAYLGMMSDVQLVDAVTILQ